MNPGDLEGFHLEKVCHVNLNKLSGINRIIRKMANELELESSWTAYNKYGKGVKTRLIFSKSKNQNIEDLYATHYLDKKRINALKLTKPGSEKTS